jgi:penicillin-binding protein-related factor A (putative recombinase)
VSPIDGATRHAAGQSLEALVNLTGAWYARKGWAVFVENHVPTKVITRPTERGMEKLRVATGKAIVDRSGHMVRGFHLEPGARAFVPLYFDIKGFSGHSSYRHERDAVHQVEYLQDRQRDGALAFLLLIDDRAGRAWVLHSAAHLAALRAGAAVTVCERRGQYDFERHCLPTVGRTPDGSRDAPPGYHFIPLLERVLSGDV